MEAVMTILMMTVEILALCEPNFCPLFFFINRSKLRPLSYDRKRKLTLTYKKEPPSTTPQKDRTIMDFASIKAVLKTHGHNLVDATSICKNIKDYGTMLLRLNGNTSCKMILFVEHDVQARSPLHPAET